MSELFNPWHHVSVGKNAPKTVNAIIEIPKGSRIKYELDKESGLIMMVTSRLDPLRASSGQDTLDHGEQSVGAIQVAALLCSCSHSCQSLRVRNEWHKLVCDVITAEKRICNRQRTAGRQHLRNVFRLLSVADRVWNVERRQT